MIPLVVEVNRLRFEYKNRLALNSITFVVRKSEIFGLLGPNGGGKSTTFRVLSTFLPPMGGEVRILGHDVVRERALIRKRIGVVFQAPGLDRKLTVRENLIHQGHLYGLKGRLLEERIDRFLEQLGLKERSKELVETLSGGLKRRVEIAKGLLHEPELLLLDEPGTGLDPSARNDLWVLLEQLRSQGVTILLTTHFMEEAERCDQIAILDAGKIVGIGSPDELKKQIGGQVIHIKSRVLEELQQWIIHQGNGRAAFFNGVLRVEHEKGYDLVARILEKFSDRIDSITMGRPTLEDVFIHLTGHQMEEK